MKLKIVLFLLVVCLASIIYWCYGLVRPVTLVETTEKYHLVSRDCWFIVPDDEQADCMELVTPASSGSYHLPVVILRETSSQKRLDPLVYLQGGPGGAAGIDKDNIGYWLDWRRGAGIQRDLVLMDPRGTGLSQPALRCLAYDHFTLRALRQNLSLEEELVQGFGVLENCMVSMSARGFNAEHFGTEVSARDLRELITLLSEVNPEYTAWNLLGVSYGSRLAMAVASDNHQIRSLILDSVYPTGFGGHQTWPQVLDEALHGFFTWCETDANCNADHSVGLIDQLHLALSRLRDQPIHFTVRRWNGEAPVSLELNDHRFLSGIFFSLYSPYDWVHIVPAIRGVLGGERTGLDTLIESFINNALDEGFNGLAFMAVDCRDHPLEDEGEYLQQLEAYPDFADYTRPLWRYQACHLYPSSQPLIISALPEQPALLLAGALDPITPLAWAESLHGQWPRSQLKIYDSLGHAIINHNPCVFQSLGEFLDHPDIPYTVCD